MAVTLPDAAREEAVASLQAYFEENMEDPLGNIAAGSLLDFVLEEIGPSIYNAGVRDAHNFLQTRLMDMAVDVHEDEFPYWTRRGGRRMLQ